MALAAFVPASPRTAIEPVVGLDERDVIPLELSVFNPWDPHTFPPASEASITRIWMPPRRDVALPCPARLQTGRLLLGALARRARGAR